MQTSSSPLILPKSNQNPHGLIVGSGDFKYRVNTQWGMLDPDKYPVENCHGMAIDSQGRIIMITDNTTNNFLIYSKEGELLDAFGTEFPGGHAVKIVNEDGIDYMYVVDSGWVVNKFWDGKSLEKWDSPYNKVIAQTGFIAKLTIDGRIIFTIGHPQTIDQYTPEQPFRPTDIAIAPNGDLYVTDGYGSDFLLHYDAQGRFIRKWGGHNNSDSNYNLINTHGIEVDLRDKNNIHLVVSSRGERKLKRFSLEGQYLGDIDTNGAYIGGPIFKGEHFYAPVCWSHIDGKNQDDSGFISVFDGSNKVIANLGGSQPEYQDGKLNAMQSTWNIFNHCHALAVDDEGNLYVGQWKANNSYPYKLERL